MISSRNEWDPLKEVLVGSALHANWPSEDPVFATEHLRTKWTHTPVPRGPVPKHIVKETEEDLLELVHVLLQLGIIVHRPGPINFVQTQGMYNYCPRDRLLIAGTTVVDCAMMYPCRDQEIQALTTVIRDVKNLLVMPRDQHMTLDAANVCRMNDDWLYLESASGNRAAYDWLCKQFPHINIELLNVDAGVHIDSTVVPLREGVVMLNAARIPRHKCPRVFESWEKIWIDDCVPQDFYQYPYASKWLGMNVLSVDPNTVIIDAAQIDIITTLEALKFTVIPLTLRHSRTLGGGFHCVTLDLVRT